MFTRKHYKVLAKLLADNQPTPAQSAKDYYEQIVYKLCLLFESDNHRFDWDKFRQAINK